MTREIRDGRVRIAQCAEPDETESEEEEAPRLSRRAASRMQQAVVARTSSLVRKRRQVGQETATTSRRRLDANALVQAPSRADEDEAASQARLGSQQQRRANETM